MRHITFYKLILIGIIIVAGWFRLAGTYPGYPPYHSDEGISYSAAVSMIKNHNFDPLRYDYPSVVPITNYLPFKFIFIPVSWIKFYTQNLGKILDGFFKLPLSKVEYERVFQLEILGSREINALTWGRITTAFFGIGVVFLTYLLSKDLFNKKTALITALLLAVNYRLVLNSHFGLPDTYNSFFLLLSVFWSFKLYKNPSNKNYLIAAVLCGFSVATKYQPFAIFPLLYTHVMLSIKEESYHQKFRQLFRKEAIAVPFIVLFVFVALNPYAYINLEQTKVWILGVSSKYQPGRNMIDIYALSYLWHYGVGEILTIFAVCGLAYSFKRFKFEVVFLLSVLFPFMYTTVYYSGAGFYTRNFVTIIPVFLMFAGVFINILNNNFPKKSIFVITLFITLFVSKNQIYWSNIVSTTYQSQWNYKEISEWVDKNIPSKSIVSAHSSVPLNGNLVRESYDFNKNFSLMEFQAANADFAIANLDWETNDFYWWMTHSFDGKVGYFSKPSNILEETYSAMALRELSEYSIYEKVNPWQAPDSNFIVFKIPKLKVSDISMLKSFDFKDDGAFSESINYNNPKDLYYKENMFKIDRIGSGAHDYNLKSDPVNVSGLKGIHILAEMKTDNNTMNEGFIFAKFYKAKEEALKNESRLSVRLSSRNKNNNKWNEIDFPIKIPNGSNFVVIGFQVYDPALGSVYLRRLEVLASEVTENFNGFEPRPFMLENNLIFPISHGYL